MADKKNDNSAVIPSEVRELIQESQKIHGWVARLADHSGEARQEVFDKVRDDYDKRLQAVNEQLSQHRVQLGESLATRRGEVESLRSDRDEHQAELEEAKLRHAVGEFADTEWKKRQETITESLDALDELLSDEESTVSELDAIISSIGSAGPRLVVDEPGPTDSTPGVAMSDATEAAEPADGDAAAGSDTAEAAATDQPQAEVSTPDTSADADQPDADDGEYLDELEFLESLSLGDSDRFDAVSAMLEDEDSGKGSD